MIHRTFRSLNEAPKLAWFTGKQWVVMIAGSGLLVGVIHLARVPAKPAITLCVFVVGLPAALTYVSESGGLQLSVVLRSMWCWRWSSHTLAASVPGQPSRTRGIVLVAEGEQPAEEQLGEHGSRELEDELPWER